VPLLAADLASIVAPLSADVFLKNYWRKHVFHCPGFPNRASRVLDSLGATDHASLLEQSQHHITVAPYPGGASRSRPSLAETLRDYANGYTLYLRLKDDAPISWWTAALGEELGEPPIGVTSIFAVRNRNGTRLHVDWNENFTIQLRGTKRWLVAPNDFIVNPVTNWAIGDDAPPYSHSPRLPTAVPEDATAYELTPGSVLYVPRGFVHEVKSVDDADSLSLNMSFPASPWATVLCTLLSTRLLESPEFRDSLNGVFGRGWGREEFFRRLPDMMIEFFRNARALDADVRGIVDDRRKLEEYLYRRRYPVL